MDTNTSNPKREQRELRSIELQQIATRTAEPAPEEEQTLFGFLEEVSLSSKKLDRDATSSILQPSSSHIATETAGEKAALLRCCKNKTAASTKTKKQTGELS